MGIAEEAENFVGFMDLTNRQKGLLGCATIIVRFTLINDGDVDSMDVEGTLTTFDLLGITRNDLSWAMEYIKAMNKNK